MTEQSLHNQLKERYMVEGAEAEAAVDGYVVDVVRDGLLVEVQTGNFSAIKEKLRALLDRHRVRLVYPVPRVKWIIRLGRDGAQVSRRRSPKRGRVEEVFYELVYIPEVCGTHGFELEVVLVDAEEYLIDDGMGGWRRRGWSVHDRKLIEVHESRLFSEPRDYVSLLPGSLPAGFTALQLAEASGLRVRLAQKMVYALRRMGVIVVDGKQGRSNLYRVSL